MRSPNPLRPQITSTHEKGLDRRVRPESWRYHLGGNGPSSHTGSSGPQGAYGAIEQRDAADEGRLDARGSIIVGKDTVNQAKVVRPSQLIASVGRLR